MLNEKSFIQEKATVIDALKKLDEASSKILLVVNGHKILKGIISDGDIRRSILSGHDLKNSIQSVYNKTPIVVFEKDNTRENIQKILVKNEIEALPIVDENWRVIDFIKWEDVFSSKKSIKSGNPLKDIPVVIMAGGKGTRMEPFTTVLPKPLIPIGDKTILEKIMEEFSNYGVNKFFLTLNYKGEMIEAYFKSIEKKYDISFVWEKDFCGTAGSLKLLEELIQGTFIVSNCDIIIKADYEDVINFHKHNKAQVTTISSMLHHTIPYGVVEFHNGGEIKGIREKPELNFTINTGMYIMEKECLTYLLKDMYMDMPQLIEKLIKKNKRAFTYPVKESDYIDIGQWDEYRSAVKKLGIV